MDEVDAFPITIKRLSAPVTPLRKTRPRLLQLDANHSRASISASDFKTASPSRNLTTAHLARTVAMDASFLITSMTPSHLPESLSCFSMLSSPTRRPYKGRPRPKMQFPSRNLSTFFGDQKRWEHQVCGVRVLLLTLRKKPRELSKPCLKRGSGRPTLRETKQGMRGEDVSAWEVTPLSWLVIIPWDPALALMAAIILMSRTSDSPRRGGGSSFAHHNFPLMLLAPPPLYDLFDSHDFQATVKSNTHLESINLVTKVPDSSFSGAILYLRSTDLADKFDALGIVMKEMHRTGEGREVSIFIPEDMVSPFIGTHGRGVFALQDQTHTKIQVEKPVEGLRERQVRISGVESDVHNAIEILYRKVVDRRQPTDFSTSNSVKFAIPQTCAAHLIGKGGAFTKAIQKQHGIELKVSSDASCKEKELGAVLIGKKSRCLEALDEVIKKMEEAIYNSDTPKNGSRTVVLLKTRMSESNINNLARAIKKELEVSMRVYAPINDEYRVEILGDLRQRQKATLMLIEGLEAPKHHHSPRRRSRSRSRSPSPLRTTISVAVPRALVGRLIGKSGENVKALKGKSGCHINFQQQNLKEVKTADGQEARVCTMTGPSGAIALGVRLLWEQILKFETIA